MTSSVWTWISELVPDLRKSGQSRLAEQVMSLADWAVNGQVDMVQAAVPEVIAASQTLGIPWLAVFARHWELQCRTVYRGEGESVLGDAVRAFELAHREQVRDCPQAICTAQDLVIAYANSDGPGYVNERIEALNESIERVEPRRECFQCLAEEMAEAYLDSGRTKDALSLFESTVQRVRASGMPMSEYFLLERPAILIAAGDPPGAIAALDGMKRSVQGSRAGRSMLRWRVLRAAAEARLGAYEKAKAELPAFEEVLPYAREHVMWAATVHSLSRAGEMANDDRLGREMDRILSVHERGGAHRRAVELARIGVELAVERGNRSSARWSLDRMQHHATKLRRPDSVQADIDAARSLAATVTISPAPVEPSSLAAHLAANPDIPPEVALDWIEDALQSVSSDPDLILLKAQVEWGHGRREVAIATLRSWVRKNGPDLRHAGLLTQFLIAEGRDGEIQQLVADIMPTDPVTATWLQAQLHAARAMWRECMDDCERIIAQVPDAKNSRRLLARAARETGHWAVAVQRLHEVCLSDAAQPDDQWQLIVAASVLGDWNAVRQAADRLDMKLDGEGPIEGHFGTCWVLPKDEAPSGDSYFALRTSPAIARIVSVMPAERPQRAGDVVVIDPAPLEPPPEDPEVRKSWVPTFREVAVLERNVVKAFSMFGPDPGNEEWTQFATAVRDRGWFIWVLSGDSYRVMSTARKQVPGIFAALAISESDDLPTVVQTLAGLTSGWAAPLAWPELARVAKVDVAIHEKLEKRYELKH